MRPNRMIVRPLTTPGTPSRMDSHRDLKIDIIVKLKVMINFAMISYMVLLVTVDMIITLTLVVMY